jgi:hypothetical protein
MEHDVHPNWVRVGDIEFVHVRCSCGYHSRDWLWRVQKWSKILVSLKVDAMRHLDEVSVES